MNNFPLVTKHAIREQLGISPSTLKEWRLGRGRTPPRLTEGIHWVRYGSRDVRYNLALLHDYLVNGQAAPELHDQAIEHYLASLPSSQRRAIKQQRRLKAL